MQESSRRESEFGFDEVSQFDRADLICDAYERAWLSGQQPCLEDYLGDVSAAERVNVRRELEAVERDYEQRQVDKAAGRMPEPMVINDADRSRQPDDQPPRIVRYAIERLLGEGGFGKVYLARDEQLRRLVAVKVPYQRSLARVEHAEIYLAEARILANLDHPHIVPVYDVGSTADCPCYVVSKYIEGCDLATSLKQVRLGYHESAALVASVADALHYAHTQGIFHRDVKPGNILLGSQGVPYVVDFGLAMCEEDIGMGPRYLGTPAYMSPEQASGEGHRLDARSDVFSLGVVLYELLAGRRPFQGDSQEELMGLVRACEPPPLDQFNGELPTELQRICRKVLSKRPDDRYATAQELAADLRQFLATTCLGSTGEFKPQAPAALLIPKRLNVSHASIVILVSLILLALLMRICNVGMSSNVEDNLASRIVALQNVAAIDNESTTSGVNIHDAYEWPADRPPPAIAPFDGEWAKRHQRAWADYLGVPVEFANSIGMKFRLIPPGELTMGTKTKTAETQAVLENGVLSEEISRNVKSGGPQHPVILTQPIYLGVYEVTLQQYESMMGSHLSEFAATGIRRSKASNLDTRNIPVEKVSWNDAAKFCAKLSEMENGEPFILRQGEIVTVRGGVSCRLPTEAEWEFACRAGMTASFSLGDDDDELRQFGGWGLNSGRRTHAAGERNANPFGLCDMHAKVGGLVQDEWIPSLNIQSAAKPEIKINRQLSAGSQGFVRGGPWVSSWIGRRSAARIRADSARRSESRTGFRIVMTVDAVRRALQFEKFDSNKNSTWPAHAPPLAIAPFGAAGQADAQQQDGADGLDVPVRH